MIGTQSSGSNNLDNQHEGYGGARISGVLEKVLASGTLRHHPNVVLLMAGTNDMKEDDPPVPESVDFAPHRLGVLIDAIFCECPDTILFVAKITGQRPPAAQTRVQTFNAAIEGIVAERKSKGKKIQLVDQSGVMALELADDLHPNDGISSRPSPFCQTLTFFSSWLPTHGPKLAQRDARSARSMVQGAQRTNQGTPAQSLQRRRRHLHEPNGRTESSTIDGKNKGKYPKKRLICTKFGSTSSDLFPSPSLPSPSPPHTTRHCREEHPS